MVEWIVQYATAIQTVIGCLIAIGTLGVAIKKFIINPITKIGVLLNKVEEISKTILPNGGSSIIDRLSRIEKAQIVIENKYKLLSLALGIAMFEADKDGKFIWVSEEWTKHTGIHRDELDDNHWLNGIHEDDRSRVFKEWIDSMAQSREFLCKFRLKNIINDKIISVKCTTITLRDFSGRMIGIIGIVVKD